VAEVEEEKVPDQGEVETADVSLGVGTQWGRIMSSDMKPLLWTCCAAAW
jgi:hypothetical protein